MGYLGRMTTKTKTESGAVKVARYLNTKHFIGGFMEGITCVSESSIPFHVGFIPSKPYFGSPYISCL